MKKNVREFLEEEAVGAARSKTAKREARKRIHARMLEHLALKAEMMEANGNPAAAEQFRKFWGRISNGRYSKAFP